MADAPQPLVKTRNVVLWLALALVTLALALVLPVNLRSVTPALLEQAGRESSSLVDVGLEKLELEKLGPAELVLAAAKALSVPRADVLEKRIQTVRERRPDWVPWGGGDPFLDPIFNLRDNRGRTSSTPVLEFLVPEKGRAALRTYLQNTRSLGVEELLKAREIPVATSFVPVSRPGGQALESALLLSALLYQADAMSSPLQREVKALAEEANAQKRLAPLEPFLLDLVSLGRRLNWIQLAELMKLTRSTGSVAEFAQLARAVPEDLPLIYAGAQAVTSADWVASYLIERGRAGLDDVRFAARQGTGALRILLRSGLPINRTPSVRLGSLAEAALVHPGPALALRYACFILSAFALLRAAEAVLLGGVADRFMRLRAGILALVLGGLFIVASEPFLLRKLPLSEFRAKFVMPVLGAQTEQIAQKPVSLTHMDTKTILSIALFASLQVVMYLICLRKIREIDRQPVSPAVKLRLMKNEENLFDGGLYIGIGGTATALVLQVLGVIEANLLAAYSSNLFGIMCVAMVKIRSVRPYTHRLILEQKDEDELAIAERKESEA